MGMNTHIAKPEAKRRVVGDAERGGECVATRRPGFDHTMASPPSLRGDWMDGINRVEITLVHIHTIVARAHTTRGREEEGGGRGRSGRT